MNIDGRIRDLGPVDATQLADAILQQERNAWLEANHRQNVYEVHRDTESMVLVFTDTTAWPELVVKKMPAWDRLIRRGASRNGVKPSLVKAVVHVESLFNPRAVSEKGAQGLMQLMPATARELGVDDPFDPWQNIKGGTRYLGKLMRRFDGDLNLALAAYHAGPTAVRRHGGVPPYPTTRNYVKRVLRFYRKYDADFR